MVAISLPTEPQELIAFHHVGVGGRLDNGFLFSAHLAPTGTWAASRSARERQQGQSSHGMVPYCCQSH